MREGRVRIMTLGVRYIYINYLFSIYDIIITIE